MQLNAFITSLLPTFTKSVMHTDLRMLREEFNKETIPPYITANKNFGRRKFTAPWVAAFDKSFAKEVKTPFNGNFLSVTYESLLLGQKSLDLVDRMIESYYADDIVREAMTLQGFNLLQYMEALSFLSRYSRRLLNFVLACEINTCLNNDQFQDIVQQDIDWINTYKATFFQVINIIGNKGKNVDKVIEAMPDVIVTKSNADTLVQTVGQGKVDPMGFNFIPLTLNPVFHIRMAIAEWQAKRFKAAVEERKIIELRLYNLKQAAGGKPDARQQQEINYMESERLHPLNKKLQEWEKEYA